MDAHPIDLLREEHELVRMTIGAMEREVAAIERTGTVHGVRVARMVDFARHFTDGCHHHKEEDLLFPALRDRNAGVDAAVGDHAGGTPHGPGGDRRRGRGALRCGPR